jgi:glycine C-acetyltransferase
VVYPVVPKGVIMLRLIPTAVHTMADVEETIQAFTEVKEKLDKQVYSLDDFANSARSKA